MFAKKTTDSVMSAFKKTVTELQEVETANIAEADKQQRIIEAAKAAQKAAEDEALKASKAAQKLIGLFSE